jgi:hypothetical protein
MRKILRWLMVAGIIMTANSALASDPFEPPLKSHQLLSRISGHTLRDPKSELETFDLAFDRLRQVIEKSLPKEKRPALRTDLEERAKTQLPYATNILNLTMRATLTGALSTYVTDSCPAYAEDGQSESIPLGEEDDQSAARVISKLKFDPPERTHRSASDRLNALIGAYTGMVCLQGTEMTLIRETLTSLCPYTIGAQEKELVEKHFSYMSKADLREEVESLPLQLYLLTYLTPHKVRYIDLFCCRTDPALGTPRVRVLQRLHDHCLYIKEAQKLTGITADK